MDEYDPHDAARVLRPVLTHGARSIALALVLAVSACGPDDAARDLRLVIDLVNPRERENLDELGVSVVLFNPSDTRVEVLRPDRSSQGLYFEARFDGADGRRATFLPHTFFGCGNPVPPEPETYIDLAPGDSLGVGGGLLDGGWEDVVGPGTLTIVATFSDAREPSLTWRSQPLVIPLAAPSLALKARLTGAPLLTLDDTIPLDALVDIRIVNLRSEPVELMTEHTTATLSITLSDGPTLRTGLRPPGPDAPLVLAPGAELALLERERLDLRETYETNLADGDLTWGHWRPGATDLEVRLALQGPGRERRYRADPLTLIIAP